MDDGLHDGCARMHQRLHVVPPRKASTCTDPLIFIDYTL